jgi:2-iminobutanoate/2-iminopropanoate deaminase
VRAGDAIFVSGQIPLDPASGQLVPGGIAEQAERVMLSLAAILAASGCGFRDVVKTTIYLVDLAHFGAVNEVYARHFEPPYPARATVQVAALPRGAQVEVDAIAIAPAVGAVSP